MLGDRTGCPFAARCPLATDLCRETEPELVVVPVGHVGARASTGPPATTPRRSAAATTAQVFSDGVVDNVIA